MTVTVKLSIKAANGSVDDFKVSAQTDWTIYELKKHLYRHYPTHPPLTSQKLIYGGHLLVDHQTIGQSLPIANGDTIVVHLVAYERSQSSPAGLVNEASPKPVSRQPSLAPLQEDTQPTSTPPSNPSPQPTTGSNNMSQPTGASNNQANTSQTPDANNQWLMYRGQTHPMMMGMYPGQYPAQFYASPYGAAYANQMAMWYQNYYGRQVPTVAQAEPGEDNIDLVNPALGVQPNVEIEDDVPVNAAGGAAGLGMMAGGGAGGRQRGRDLVDVLYMSTMLAFLGLVAYLTGSLGRLVVFAGGIIFMLLNQGGWFAVRRRRPVAPANDVNPLNRPQQLPPRQEGQQPGEDNQQDQNQPPQDETDQPVDNESPLQEPQEQLDNQRQGVLATLFVFVTSFFTSLIPHQRPELQAN